jgi:5-methylcytosine-specific restriction endonuclease McrBC GTP-binding regulatory subunit McrB
LKQRLALEQQKEEETKQHIIEGMLANWIKSVDFVNQKVTVKTNPGSVNVIDEWLIPTLYVKEKITKSVDKTAIKNAIKEWKEVPGAEIVQSYSLVISPK